jgi:TetR/AcrR family transcriptional regulator, repressor for neighboring sulfatase
VKGSRRLGARRAARIERREGLGLKREGLGLKREGRRRRSPDVARTELLDAAERMFAKHAPDDVGLKDIAREAGTSHALITHYFGTYAGLVEQVLQRRLLRLRETMAARLVEAGAMERPEELLAIVFRTLDDPVHLRLMKWVIASDRQESVHVLALQHQGVTLIAHQVAATIAPTTITADARRALVEKLELALVTALAAAMGYAFGKSALAATVGRAPDEALDTGVRRTLAAMLKAYIAEAIG